MATGRKTTNYTANYRSSAPKASKLKPGLKPEQQRIIIIAIIALAVIAVVLLTPFRQVLFGKAIAGEGYPAPLAAFSFNDAENLAADAMGQYSGACAIGTDPAGSLCPTSVAGATGNAAEFTTSTGYLRLNTDPSNLITLGAVSSILFKVKESSAGTLSGRLLSGDDGINPFTISFSSSRAGNFLLVTVGTQRITYALTSTTGWQDFALIRVVGDLSLYHGGRVVGAIPLGRIITIESIGEPGTLQFQGQVDELLFFNVALTENQLADFSGGDEICTDTYDNDADSAVDCADDECAGLASCPAVDSDGDSVADDADLCADTASGAAVDANGCADLQVDSDGDGTCDLGAPSVGPAECTADPCEGIECQNGGTCSAGTCTCTEGFTGDLCQSAVEPVIEVPAGPLTLTSTSFANNGDIPLRHACAEVGGENVNPPLEISNLPAGTNLLNLFMIDASITAQPYHWSVTIPIEESQTSYSIGENWDAAAAGATLNANYLEEANYAGPCPSEGEDAHRYAFQVYANSDTGILAQASFVGMFAAPASTPDDGTGTSSLCGNSVLDGDEACDDGNAADGDGCSAICAVEEGYTCSGVPSVCTLTSSVSGDADACPDIDADGYDTCAIGVDGSDANPADCNDNSAYVNPGAVEVCNSLDNDCDGTVDSASGVGVCTTEANCGSYDNSCTESENCVEGSCQAVVVPAACGDGALDDGEACDDGNAADGDGCSAICAVEEGYTCSGVPSVCTLTSSVSGDADACPDIDADGYDTCAIGVDGSDANPADCNDNSADVNPGAGEVCNSLDNDCDGTVDSASGVGVCTTDANCGSYGNSCAEGESCVEGSCQAGVGIMACTSDEQCTAGSSCVDGACVEQEAEVVPAACGDGALDDGEACDDGNAADGDGCSAICAVEEGYTCSGTPSECTLAPVGPAIEGPVVCEEGQENVGGICLTSSLVDAVGPGLVDEIRAEPRETPLEVVAVIARYLRENFSSLFG